MPTLRSTLRLALLTVGLSATLSACGRSPASGPRLADLARPDPIVTVDRRTEFVCPTQLDGPVEAKPVPPADSLLEGSPAALGWVGALARWGDDLAGRIAQAQAACREARK